MGSFQLEDFVAGWIGGECACERPRTTGQSARWCRASCLHPVCSVNALCIAGFITHAGVSDACSTGCP